MSLTSEEILPSQELPLKFYCGLSLAHPRSVTASAAVLRRSPLWMGPVGVGGVLGHLYNT